jgi:hypothetical protein
MKKFIESDKYTVNEDGCWLWNGAKNLAGYGQLNVDGQKVYAHRVSYIENKGEIIGNNVVMHSCNCTSCVNPDHLSQGTQAQNIQQASVEGRLAGGKVGRKKLSPNTVMLLRREYAAGYSMYAIAKMHNIPQTTVFGIVTGQRHSMVKA